MKKMTIKANPLFIPLKTQYYNSFCDGSKTTEYRLYGPRWNENTCQIGRSVLLSKGYGKQNRVFGIIVGFSKKHMSSKSWLDCYGKPAVAACIEIKINNKK